MEDYEVSNVTIELERKVGVQWVDVGDEETDEDGERNFQKYDYWRIQVVFNL